MNFILLILFLIISLTLSQSYIEVCEPFPVHHNFYNCGGVGRRLMESTEEIVWVSCPNQGTWDCSTFRCYRDDGVDMDGYCLYGSVRQNECCTYKNIHYVDVWISPNNATYNMTEIPDRRRSGYDNADWWIEVYNLDIRGSGPDIYIESEYLFPNVYPNVTKESELLFISIILRYNESCHMWVEVYINAILVANSTHDAGLDMWTGKTLYPMVEIENIGEFDDDQVFFISAHEIIPTLEQIEYLYSLGPNRTTDVEICHDTEHDLCHGSCTSELVSDTYFTLTIIFGVIFGILFCLLLGIVLWWFMRKKTNNMYKEGEEEFKELDEF